MKLSQRMRVMDKGTEKYNHAFEELNRIKENYLMGELNIKAGEVFFHAGQDRFSFDNQKALWTAKDISESEAYLNWDVDIGMPVRNMYKLSTKADAKFLFFSRNFTGNFFSDFCDLNHTLMAKILTAWGSGIKSNGGVSEFNGLAYKGADEFIFFKGGEILEVDKV